MTQENLGTPFNSSKDDFSFFLDADFKNGFFSSDRSGGKGLDDIYTFEYLDIPLQVFVYGNSNPLSGATLSISAPDEEPAFLNFDKGSISLVLKPNTVYPLSVMKDGFTAAEFELRTGGSLQPLQKHITLKPAQ